MSTIILMAQLLLIALGVAGLSASDPEKLPRHLVYCVLALGVTFVVSRVRSSAVVKLGAAFWTVIVCSLVLALFIGDGPGGVRRWINIGPVDFQPSEFAKIALIAYLASFFTRRGTDYPLAGPVAVIGATAALVLMSPSFSAGIFIFVLALAVMFAAGVGLLRILSIVVIAGAVAAPVAGTYLQRYDYVFDRMQIFQRASQGQHDPLGESFQNLQAQRIIDKAGPLGLGPDQPMSILPASSTDFIAISVAHSTGLLGISLCLLAFWLVLRHGLRAADVVAQGAEFQRDPELHGAAVLAAGATILLVGQAAANLGVAIGLLPNTGIPLPMMSHGGSNMIVAGVAFGWIHAALRQVHRVAPEAIPEVA